MKRAHRHLCAALLALTLPACTIVPPGPPEPPAPEPIPRAEYPAATASARDVFAFFRRATVADDPEAAYFCLWAPLKRELTLAMFYEGWTLAGRYLPLFGKAQVLSARDVAEYRPPYQGRLLEVDLEGLRESFLWVREDEGWKLALPSPYNERDLLELFEAVKEAGADALEPRIRPDRRGG